MYLVTGVLVLTTLETDGKKQGNGRTVPATCISVFRFSIIVVLSSASEVMSLSRFVS